MDFFFYQGKLTTKIGRRAKMKSEIAMIAAWVKLEPVMTEAFRQVPGLVRCHCISNLLLMLLVTAG